MRYEDLKRILVEESGKLTSKELKKLSIRLGFLVIGITLIIGSLVLRVFNSGAALITMVFGLVAYMWIFDACAEDEVILRRVRKIARLWVIPFVLFVVESLVLSYFGF